MKLADDVDLESFAKRTKGFSGADLQGFLYNAHLEAIHNSIDMETFKDTTKKEEQIKSEFIMNGVNKLTLAERGHISQRVSM